MFSINKLSPIQNNLLNISQLKYINSVSAQKCYYGLYSHSMPKVSLHEYNLKQKQLQISQILNNKNSLKLQFKSYYSQENKENNLNSDNKENTTNSNENENKNNKNNEEQKKPDNNKYSIILGLTAISVTGALRVHRRLIENRLEEIEDENQIKIEGSPIMKFYSMLPLRILSRFAGKLMNITIPVKYRERVFRFYARKFNCNLEEILNENLESYTCIADFFYRKIKPNLRPIDSKTDITSPVDGTVLQFGEIVDNQIEQVKGFTYSVNALLGYKNHAKNYKEKDIDIDTEKLSESVNRESSNKNLTDKKFCKQYKIDTIDEIEKKKKKLNKPDSLIKKGNKLFYCVIYLSPGDYHHFHSPTNWIIEKRRHFTGHLLSVAPKFVNLVHNLFAVNERVALIGRWKHGFFSMIPVGATNVGSVVLTFDENLTTNLPFRKVPVKRGLYTERSYSNYSNLLHGISIHKGEELGGFKMGSTVILVFEAPNKFKFNIKPAQKIKFGQSICEK